MNRKIIILFSVFVWIVCSAKRCRPSFSNLPPSKDATIILSDFIGDCKAGNENGITNNDVSYTVKVQVRHAAGNNFENSTETFYQVFQSPTGPDKKVFTKAIKVLQGSFYLRVTVDGIDGSLCAKGGCNPYNLNGFQVNNAPPFWQSTPFYIDGNLDTYNIIPKIALRNPNGTQPCNCKIKL
jgi:hypothetical protein